jgi:hypothetical protein
MAKKCSVCKKEFQDGEIVGVALDGNYHYVMRNFEEDAPLDCITMRKMVSDGLDFKKTVYYKNSFYGINKLNKLAQSVELNFEFNQQNNGDIVKGNLEGLAKKRFLIF